VDEDLKELAIRVNRLGGAATQFEQIVDGVLSRVRTSLGAPAPGGRITDEVVEAELAAARDRLLQFQPEFDELIADALAHQLGGEDLAAAAAGLAHAGVQRFLRAQPGVAATAEAELQRLLRKMTEAILLEEPSP